MDPEETPAQGHLPVGQTPGLGLQHNARFLWLCTFLGRIQAYQEGVTLSCLLPVTRLAGEEILCLSGVCEREGRRPRVKPGGMASAGQDAPLEEAGVRCAGLGTSSGRCGGISGQSLCLFGLSFLIHTSWIWD